MGKDWSFLSLKSGIVVSSQFTIHNTLIVVVFKAFRQYVGFIIILVSR